MTRRMLALFAPSLLAAQQNITVTCKGMDCQVTKAVPRIPRPRNGECPACGTMAPSLDYRADVQLLPECKKPSTPDEKAVCEIAVDIMTKRSPSRRVDCEHCGCTFRQWAEGMEPKR